MKYTGQLVTGDLEENTMTFKIEGEMILQAGKYTITRIENERELKNCDIGSVSHSYCTAHKKQHQCHWFRNNNNACKTCSYKYDG